MCHYKLENQVTQSYLTLSDPMDCSLPGFSIHRIFQAKVLESGAIAFSIIILSNSYFCNTLSTSHLLN